MRNVRLRRQLEPAAPQGRRADPGPALSAAQRHHRLRSHLPSPSWAPASSIRWRRPEKTLLQKLTDFVNQTKPADRLRVTAALSNGRDLYAFRYSVNDKANTFAVLPGIGYAVSLIVSRTDRSRNHKSGSRCRKTTRWSRSRASGCACCRSCTSIRWRRSNGPPSNLATFAADEFIAGQFSAIASLVPFHRRNERSLVCMPNSKPRRASEAAPPAGLGAKILDMARQLAQFSETPDGLTCTYLSPAHKAAAAQLRDWMQTAGLAVRIDAVPATSSGRYASAARTRQRR